MNHPAFPASHGPEINGQIAPVHPVEFPCSKISGATLRAAHAGDLPELIRLEKSCFEDWRQDSRRVIRESLRAPRREIWILTAGNDVTIMAALFLRLGRSSLRVYSLATDPAHQGSGLGAFLMQHALARARALDVALLHLEADAGMAHLLSWYESLGYAKTTLLNDFYGPGHHAWQMTRKTSPSS